MTDLRLKKRELFASIGYEPHPGQVLVHRSTAKRRVLICGSRWGKSMCAAYEVVAALLEPRPKSIGWLVAPNYDSTDRIFKRVVDVMEAHYRHRIRDLVPREHRIIVTNLRGGVSELRAKTADNPTSLLGEGLDWLVVDEAARLKRAIWDEHLSQRLIDRNGWALLVSTPCGKNWMYSVFKRGQDGHTAEHESWCSPSWENPHLDRTIIEAQRSLLGEDAFAQEYGAEFIGRDDEPCPVCKGPSALVEGCIVIEEGEEVPTCRECGGAVNADGHTVVGLGIDGQPILLVIEECGYDGSDAPPMDPSMREPATSP